jgi:chromosome segregation ATPase
MDDDEEEENPLDKLTRELGEFRAEYTECTTKFSLNFDSHLGFINENLKSIAKLEEKVDKNKDDTDHDIKELKDKMKKKVKKLKNWAKETFVEHHTMLMDRPTFD